MTDRFGLLQIPTTSGTLPFAPVFPGWGVDGAPQASDPCLAIIADFVATWITTDQTLGPLWSDICGTANKAAIRTILMHDPHEVVFKADFLPGLFVWRARGKQEWVADDWLRETSTVTFLWVYPLATGPNQRVRQPFVSALEKSINTGIERGRTPGWKQPGDPDPIAATDGSLFWRYAGFDSFNFTTWQRARLDIQPAGGRGDAQSFPGIEMTFELVELLTYGLDRFATVLGADGTVNVQSSESVSIWTPATVYAYGAVVIPSTPNGFMYQASSPTGYSGTTEPTWPTNPGDSVTDKTVTWVCIQQTTRTIVSGPL